MESRSVTLSEMMVWGRFIRKHFVLDNLLSLPVEYIKSNMGERELSEQYVGVHTFAETLERGVQGYRQVVSELQDVKAMLHQLLDAVHGMRGAESCSSRDCPGHPRRDSLHDTTHTSHDQASDQAPQSTLALLGRPWPADFMSLRDVMLQDLIVRYVRDGLAFAAHAPGNRAQKDVNRAIHIVRQFAEMSSFPSGQTQNAGALTLVHQQALSAFARDVQASVLRFIELHRPQLANRKRSRTLTGLVAGVVRAWGQLAQSTRDLAGQSPKLRFHPPM
jgi:hypothetical protein